MGFVAPFIPTIAGAIGGIFAGKKATSAAMKRSPEEQQALTGAQGAAGGLQQAGTSLLQQGSPYLQKAGGYYSTLLGGNRAAMSQAVAGPRAALTDVYRGAERGLERSGVRGATRELAEAELGRDRASRIAGLTTGVQPSAAAALADLGGGTAQLGLGAMQAGGGIYGRLLGEGAQNRYYGRSEGERFSSGVGGLLFDILSGTMKFGKRPLQSSTPWGSQYPISGPPVL